MTYRIDTLLEGGTARRLSIYAHGVNAKEALIDWASNLHVDATRLPHLDERRRLLSEARLIYMNPRTSITDPRRWDGEALVFIWLPSQDEPMVVTNP